MRVVVGSVVVFNNNSKDYALRNAADFRGLLSAAKPGVLADDGA